MPLLSTENRRRSQRQWAAVPVRIHVSGSRVDGVTINLSDHGMCVFAVAHLSIGAELEIAFRRPGEERLVRAYGVVRRRAVYLYGIEFLNNYADRNLQHAENLVPVADSTT